MSNPYPACTSCRDGLEPISCAWSNDLPRDGDCRAHVAWSEGYAQARTDLEAILREQAEAVIASLRADGEIK